MDINQVDIPCKYLKFFLEDDSELDYIEKVRLLSFMNVIFVNILISARILYVTLRTPAFFVLITFAFALGTIRSMVQDAC